ncbi:MAG: hypothetical protein EVA87_07995 [Rhodospirillaceae bacterium]|nr:hypothetical protein [Rhodospirillaceae bacterium]RPG02033.1 MAG: hypothetical protein CBC23_004020 [Rhodospirillaceae bacterium TMED63]RZO37151.1 MAG: hypothetical protein EVA87_07995 [Rhodospirillaceae bacterium]
MEKTYFAAVTVPLDRLLPAGLPLWVDARKLVRSQPRLSNVNGCRGQLPVSEDVRPVF